MSWQLSDPYGVEDDIRSLGDDVWKVWTGNVLPELLDDPTPTNGALHITETHTTQVWLPHSDVYVLFFLTSDRHVLLIKAADLAEEIR